MAGIGQSSLPSSDQTSPWNNSQFSMGRSGALETHAGALATGGKYCGYSLQDKRTFSDQRMISEENGVLPQNMYSFNRQQTGFQSSNIISNEKSYISNIQSNMNLSSTNNAMNYNMYQRNMNDSALYPPSHLDMSSQSKQGFNSSSRMGTLPQYMDGSLSSNSYLSPAPHRTISGSTMNPNVPIYNGQNIKNRSYNFDSNSASLIGQWETPIGNFDSADFPCLNKPKVNPQLSQMPGNYNYGVASKPGQINYQQMVMKTGPSITPGEHSNEFSIQQEDFPALPVAQNPVISSTETTQRSSSATGITAAAFTTGSSDIASRDSQNSSAMMRQQSSVAYVTTATGLVDSLLDTQSKFQNNNLYDLQMLHEPPTSHNNNLQQQQQQQPASSVSSSSISSSNNSSQQNSKLSSVSSSSTTVVPKKIIQGPNNYITNIPSDMVSDAFGLIGLVKLININEKHDNLTLLAPGLDTLSLNKELNSTKDIYHSYVSPLSSNCAGRPQDMDYPVPKEYRIRHLILDKLADPLPDRLSDETLFWIFYNLTGEECQITAAKQLMARQWRYNKKEKYWLTRDSKGVNESVTYQNNLERGNFIVWDSEKAQRVSKVLTVFYRDLEVTPPATTKTQFPFCYNSPFVKRSNINSSSASSGMLPQLSVGRSINTNSINNSNTGTAITANKNLATLLQNPSDPVAVATARLLNIPSSQNFQQSSNNNNTNTINNNNTDPMTPTSSQIRVQINNNHAPPSIVVSQQQQQQQQSTQ